MTAATPTLRDGQPLVAVVCSVPMIFEALHDALHPIANVRSFPAKRGTAGLLRSVRPDAVIVDDDDEVADAELFAREFDLPLVHVSVRDSQIRVLQDGVWVRAGNGDAATPESVRNAVAGGLFARRRA